MKTKHLIYLLLLPLFATGQVTFPSPETIATKKYVDSLVTKRLENLGGAEKPEDKPCKHPLRIDGIFSVTQAGLTYRFDSEGVKQIRETIRDAAGKTVWTHYSNPTWNTIPVYFDLKPGMYSLALENTACVAGDTAVFAIPAAGTEEPGTGDPDPPVGGEGFVNPGVFSEKVGSLLYEWIPGEGVEVEIRNGRVRIVCPETIRSFDGSNECKRYLLGDLYDNRLPASEESALFGDGLALPPGQYAFKILYVNSPNWDKARKNLWSMIGKGGGGESNSAQVKTLTLSITDGSAKMQHYRASWIPLYLLLPGSLNLPESKAFGVTRYLATMPKDSLLRKITHIQYTYNWVTDFSRAWKNLQAYDGSGKLIQPDFLVEHAILDKNYILMSEAAENYGNLEGDCPRCYLKVEDAYRRIYERFVREQGVTSPAQTWLVADYFSPLYGGSININFDQGVGVLKQGLSSIRLAQSYRHEGQWHQSAYISSGWRDYRNFMAAGYLGNILQTAGSPELYSRIYNLEKANLAIPDRKKLTYGTNAQDALGIDVVTGAGAWYRAKLPGGELIRVDGLINSFTTMQTDAFWALLLGDAFILWESNITLDTDPENFDKSWFGGQDDWKTKWKPDGGIANTYIPGINGPVRKQRPGQFPEKPMVGDQGAWTGAKLFEAIQDRVAVLIYPDYDFNGKTIRSKRGDRGQLVSYNGVQNEGQDNIVQAWEKELPICMVGEGSEGKCVIFQNPNAGLTGVSNVLVEGRSFTFTGNRLNVVRL